LPNTVRQPTKMPTGLLNEVEARGLCGPQDRVSGFISEIQASIKNLEVGRDGGAGAVNKWLIN
jgi:hypothetical protein